MTPIKIYRDIHTFKIILDFITCGLRVMREYFKMNKKNAGFKIYFADFV